MTGKDNFTLSDIIIDLLKEIGHEYEAYGSTTNKYPYGEDTLRFKIQANDYKSLYYLVKIDKTSNTAQFDPGLFPKFDFHDPNSTILFKTAAMQMPIIINLREIGDLITNATEPVFRDY